MTSTEATLSTYVYYVRYQIGGRAVNRWYPYSPEEAQIAYTVAGPVPPEPQPELEVGISGPSDLDEGEFGTWTASPSGGTGSYDYSWYLRYYQDQPWTPLTTEASSLTYGIDLISEPRYMDVKVEVASGTQTGSAQMGFVVRNNGDDGGGGGGGGCNGVITFMINGSATTRGIPSDSVVTNRLPPPCHSVTSLQAAGAAAAGESLPSAMRLPEAFALEGNAPNPFRAQTEIHYALPKATNVELTVYDVMGREVARPVYGPKPAGFHHATFRATDLDSGVYFYRMTAGDFTGAGRMIVIK